MKKFFSILAVLALGMIFFTGCKKGCTDETALNYDPDAKKDDESCVYETVTPQVVISDNNGAGTGTTTWTKDNEYLLDGFVFVNDGDVLTIEAGTVIKGKAGQGTDASALIVARGGKIMAQGTAAEPIIFTAEIDDVADPADIPAANARGLWGGLIVLGNASLNSTPGETAIEGIPTNEARGLYGAIGGSTDDADNSGIIQYVSIRHGGTDIGAGNEINGLTLGGVGTGTTIDHVEVIFNADDGVEFFGGTVNTKYLATAFCGDDSYDYDEGFRGKGQFWFAVNASDDGDRGGEHDGGTDPETAQPYATPVVYNATYIGRGEAAGKRAVTFRDNAGGQYWNSIFTEYGKGIDIELLEGESSADRFDDGSLALAGNVFWNVAGNVEADQFLVSVGGEPTDSVAVRAAFAASFAGNGNMVMDPSLGISYTNDGGLNPNPGNSTVLNGATPAADTWFDQVTYRGAFDGSTNWLSGWSALSFYGYTN